MIRAAAIGDLHFGAGAAGRLRPLPCGIGEVADLFLIAADLTNIGTQEEAIVLADELKDIGVPVVAVLGNRDYQSDCPDLIRSILERAGIIVLEGESVAFAIGSRKVVAVGAKGFGGGFAGACATYASPR